MPRTSWFEVGSDKLTLNQYVEQMASWQRALADGVVQPKELNAQADRVAALLRALEPKLDDALHEEVTQVLYELAVFYGMERLLTMAAEQEDNSED